MIELPEAVQSKVAEWAGKPYRLLHVWEQDGTYMIVAAKGTRLYFLRLFQVGQGGQWYLSRDGEIELGDS